MKKSMITLACTLGLFMGSSALASGTEKPKAVHSIVAACDLSQEDAVIVEKMSKLVKKGYTVAAVVKLDNQANTNTCSYILSTN